MIKTTTVVYCDRCGKTCEYCINNRGFHIYPKHRLKSIRKDDYLDLCQSCYDSFDQWMKSGKVIQKGGE